MRFMCLLVLAFSSALTLGAEEKDAPQPVKQVFAHYMICIPTYGGSQKLEDYQREIKDAQQRGIDGFALNCGNWRKREPHYAARSTMIYEAAKQLGTGFKLLFSADGVAPEEAADMVLSFYDHPNQFRHNGKPVLSTFAGSTEWGKKIVELIRAAGRDVVFVPYYYPKPASEMPQQTHVDQVFNDNPTLDGFFFFGAAGTGDQVAASNALLAWSLVFGRLGLPALGVAGAGLATSIAEWIGAAVLVAAFALPEVKRRFATHPVRPDPRAIRRFLRVGLPIGGQWLLDMSAFAIFTTLVARMGNASMAATQAMISLLSMSFMQAIGIGLAATTLVG